MVRGRRVLLVSLLAWAVAVLAPGAAQAHGHRHGHRHHGASPQATAKALVAAVQRAHGSSARAKALLALMRRLHVAVYTGSGKSLVKNAAGARHAFLYDFELVALANSLERGDRVPVSKLAEQLSAAGLHRPGQALDAADLAPALALGVRDGLAHPKSPGSMPALVLSALGEADDPAVDIAHLSPSDSLDPVQAELVMVAFAELAYDHGGHGAHGGHGGHAKTSSYAPPAASQSDACGELNEAEDFVLSGGMDGLGGKAMKKTVKKIFKDQYLTKAERDSLKKAAAIEDALHGTALAFSVAVHGAPETAGPVHYDHSASEHNVLEMRIAVEMLDDYGKVVVKCGPLAGIKFPAKGGIPNVPMHWEYPNLDKHGSVVCGEGCTATGPEGIATLRLVLKGEQIPGYGIQVEDTGNADALAAYQSAFGASPLGGSFWAQYMTPKIGGVRWFVTYHKEPNLTFRLVDQHDEVWSNQQKGTAINGQYETVGTGAQHFSISAVAPLSSVTTTDGITLWTGDAPINWDAFEYKDDGASSLCQDGKMGTLDYDGSNPTPGELIVDAVQREANAPAPGIAVVFHASVEPAFDTTQTWHQEGTACHDFTNTFNRVWWTGPSQALLASGVDYTSWGGEKESPTYRVTGWTPGPASQGGEGVYAYRDFSYSQTGAWGEPISGHMRLEVVASPSP